MPAALWERLLEHAEDDFDIDTAEQRTIASGDRLSHAQVAALLQRLAQPTE